MRPPEGEEHRGDAGGERRLVKSGAVTEGPREETGHRGTAMLVRAHTGLS